MRVAIVDGLVTLFYDGSKLLFNWGLNLEWQFSFGGRTSDECKEYIRERWTWQQVIVMEGVSVIPEALAEASPFEVVSDESDEDEDEGEERADPNMNIWLKNLNNDDAYALHRACSSYQPLKEDIHAIIQDKGVNAFREKNSAGITPSQYLQENPYTDLKEMDFPVLSMRVATVDGLVTLYYDGSRELYNRELHSERFLAYAEHGRLDEYLNRGHSGRVDERKDWDDLEEMGVSDQCKRYFRDRLSWQQVIIVDGVTEITRLTFSDCENIKKVIFPNTLIRIERCALAGCKKLAFVKLSMNLEYIGEYAFSGCDISSVFIPSTCREIYDFAFLSNKNLSIFHVPQDIQLGDNIIGYTALAEASPFDATATERYGQAVNDNINQWLKNMNNGETFSLHRACSSFQPLKEVIHTIIQEKGLKAFREKNSAGITPSRYLKENPYTTLNEKEIIREYVMKMMGDVE
ncbi:hypothetical protein CTEN210_00267 [Chaetoceros tenuissimus]|uniref:Leucine-rich repeat domain-containing protein n=1 Tax=Chaetoceros tenuissimus TaxID=426638 RepID=A0AAD3CDT0_9STRA|nr:hypothetical protein CTEN210_00267 [Chaetoceros tenuissimus]